MMNPEQRDRVAHELTELINRYSLDGGSDTPDSILAEYLVSCIEQFTDVIQARKRWLSGMLGGDEC
ncbi:MAG: hypothetical protein WC895_04705, partial [Candidatus Shapirobacteria bacterium]